jgi:ATP-dependent protease ClpP protease subunit
MEETLPRYTYIFDDDIDQETIQNCIDTIHMHPEVDLFFSTQGGETCMMDAFINYLNLRQKEITVHLTDAVASAGTFLLTDFKGEIVITENLEWIMFHQTDRLTYSNRKSFFNESVLKKQLIEYNNKYSKKFQELGLTDKEIKAYNSGKDVFLYRKDFNRLNLKRE